VLSAEPEELPNRPGVESGSFDPRPSVFDLGPPSSVLRLRGRTFDLDAPTLSPRLRGMASGSSDRPFLSLPSPLHPARFVHRPNRFVVHARLEDPSASPFDGEEGNSLPPEFFSGQEVVCHMADPGRLRELLVPDRPLLIRYAPAPHRKTSWSLVLVRTPDGSGWVSVDTTLPNRLIHAALEAEALEEPNQWSLEAREFTHGRSRLDFLLSDLQGRKMALEVKSVTLVEGEEALFPDAVTSRGARHVEELAQLASWPNWEATVLFVLQRDDATRIRAARSIDPDFADALQKAREAGVRVLGRRCHVSRDRVTLGEPVPAR